MTCFEVIQVLSIKGRILTPVLLQHNLLTSVEYFAHLGANFRRDGAVKWCRAWSQENLRFKSSLRYLLAM